MRRFFFAAILGSLLAGCAAPHDGIPDPGGGDQVDVDWQDQEPNDTPDYATPLGTAKGADVVMWVGENQIGGSGNPADYFVFESSGEPGQLQFDMCFIAPITAMTASLWKVVDAKEQTPPIATWTITDSCAGSMSAPLEASTEYLFGVFAKGGQGFYTA